MGGRDKLGLSAEGYGPQADRITEKSETIEGVTTTYQYTYDRAGRLETVWENGLFVSQYTYDSNGNRLTHNATVATYNDQDMMLTYGDNSYTYTANGDLMVKTGTEGTTTYNYDATGKEYCDGNKNDDLDIGVNGFSFDGMPELIVGRYNVYNVPGSLFPVADGIYVLDTMLQNAIAFDNQVPDATDGKKNIMNVAGFDAGEKSIGVRSA